jgi:pantoate--beta-alanine ligase
MRRMARDLDLPVRIITVETVRESDGLALSSRNRYLTPDERRQASVLRAALLAAREAWEQGQTNAAKLRRLIVARIGKAPLARIDYVEVADANTLQPIRVADRQTVIALAVFFGTTRLIDNIQLR